MEPAEYYDDGARIGGAADDTLSITFTVIFLPEAVNFGAICGLAPHSPSAFHAVAEGTKDAPSGRAKAIGRHASQGMRWVLLIQLNGESGMPNP